IGANLTDGMYQGVYGSSKKHDSDLDQVIKRAFQSGLDKIIITAGTHHETIQALELCSKYGNMRIFVLCIFLYEYIYVVSKLACLSKL
ncbi:unnamed protein product, partial [Rotaria sp. Silwood1]